MSITEQASFRLPYTYNPGDTALPPGLPGRQPPSIAYLLMISYSIAGVLLAIGHHQFYRGLDGKPANSKTWTVGDYVFDPQERTVFVGTALTFLAKFFFGLCVSKAFDQQLWFTVHRKLIKIKGLDALFSVLGDPIALFSPEMLRAKTAVIVATIAWCLSIAVTAVPGAISIIPALKLSETSIIVPSLDLVSKHNAPSVIDYNNAIGKLAFRIYSYSAVQLLAFRFICRTFPLYAERFKPYFDRGYYNMAESMRQRLLLQPILCWSFLHLQPCAIQCDGDRRASLERNVDKG